MKKPLIRWLLPLIAILAIITVMALNISLGMAHAASPQHIVSPGGITIDSFWRG